MSHKVRFEIASIQIAFCLLSNGKLI